MRKKILKGLSFILFFIMLINISIVQPVFVQAYNFKDGNSSSSVGSDTRDGKTTAISLDDYPKPEVDITAASLLPLNGYFEQTVTVGAKDRKVKVYIPEGAPIRAFFTVITVPDGWDTEKFLQESGWMTIADERQEGLYILEAGKGGWGSFADELAYANAAMNKVTDTTYYSTMGMYYFVGYGKGAAALQAWAVDNPLFIISQAYIDADDLSADYLNTMGAKLYGTEIDREGYDDVAYSEIPIPTWVINKDLSSVNNTINYWRQANDSLTISKIDTRLFNSTIYEQSSKSKAWSTSYSGPISKVATLEKKINLGSNELSKTIYSFLSDYTRYDNTSVYGNGLGIRGNYDVKTIDMTEPDGRTWVREYITYVPTSYDGRKELPVVYAFGGNSQTGRVFFEATQWWQVAEENNFIVVFPSSQYSSATSATWNSDNISTATKANDFNFIKAVINEVDATYKTDPSRRYATGQSQGSGMAQRTSFYLADYFTAIGSTSSFVTNGVEDGYEGVVPFHIIMGEKDNSDYNFKVRDSAAHKAVEYWTKRNKLSGAKRWTANNKDDRYHNYIWNNAEGIPLFKYTWTEGRKHNNIHAEMELLWNSWFSHWKMEKGVRYYDGKAVNTTYKGKLEAINFADVEKPTFDPGKGNNLPITGYYEQSITADDLDRTAKVYIPENARMREYFTVLALESGTDIESFLVDSGWRDIAEANNVGLIVLVPDEDGWGDYASEKAYLDYVLNKAGADRAWYSVFGVHYFVGYGDGGDILQTWAANNPMFVISQTYVDSKANRIALERAGEEEYGSEITTFENVSKKDVPLPTWFIGEDMDSKVLSYWKGVNDSFEVGTTVSELRGSTVYKQDKENSNAIATSFNEVVSQVAVLGESVEYLNNGLSEDIYKFLTQYTRYDNTSVYGNALGDRADYKRIGVTSNYLYLDDEFGQTWEREYLFYKPENSKEIWPKGAPTVYVFSGSTQPNQLFFDSSQWWEIANEYGFNVVVPSSTGTVTSVFNRGEASATSPDDVAFVEALIEDVNKKYETDPNRAYATGQSAGSMFIQHLAMKIPEKFTVFGGTSGPVMGANAVGKDASTVIAPFYSIFGEYDYWPWVVGELKEDDFLGTMGAGQSGNTLFTQNYWINRNGLSSVDEYKITRKNNLPLERDNSIMYLAKPNSTEFAGDRYKTYSWYNNDEIPLFVWTQAAGRAHNNVVSDSWLIWEDWFSKWTREGDVLYYSESGFTEKKDSKAVNTIGKVSGNQ